MKKFISFFFMAMAIIAFAYLSPTVSADQASKSNANISQWIGKDVKNTEGKELGKVKQFVHEPDGTISLAVISHGGFWGIGEKDVAVPYGSLSFDQSKDYFVMNATKDQLDSAPEVHKGQNLASRSFEEQVYRHFGVRPYWTEQGATGMNQGAGSQSSGMNQPMNKGGAEKH